MNKLTGLRYLKDESGIALITVVGIIMVLTVVAIMAFTLTQQALKDSSNTYSQTQAFEAANSGVEAALARLQANGYSAGDYPLVSSTPDGGSFVASVTPAGNSSFVCLSTGKDKKGQTSVIKVTFFYLNIWQMNLAAGSNNALGGGTVRGTTSVTGPFYVRGLTDLNSNSFIHNGPLFVYGGDLNVDNSSEVGQSSHPIDIYVTGSYPPNGSPGVYLSSSSHAVPDIHIPTIDDTYMNNMWAQAKAESIDNIMGYSDSPTSSPECATAGGNAATYISPTLSPPNSATWHRSYAPGACDFYKVVGTDTSVAPLGTGTHPLVIGGTGSWGTWYGDGHTTTPGLHDDFAFYDANPGILYVEGTVFVDGPLTIGSSSSNPGQTIKYVGNGTIVANGDITINGDLVPNTPDLSLDPQHVLGLSTPTTVTVNTGDSNVKDPTGPPNVSGAIYCGGTFGMTKNLVVKGSIVAGNIAFQHSNQHLVTVPNLPSFLPRSVPGNGESVLIRGAWSRP